MSMQDELRERLNAPGWNIAKLDELKRLHAEGLSYRLIGERLNVSKNAVCGKVHRLGLPKRGSPIKYKRPAPPKSSKPEDAYIGRCCWPSHRDVTHPDFHFCDADTLEGKPYCKKHLITAIAHMRKTN